MIFAGSSFLLHLLHRLQDLPLPHISLSYRCRSRNPPSGDLVNLTQTAGMATFPPIKYSTIKPNSRSHTKQRCNTQRYIHTLSTRPTIRRLIPLRLHTRQMSLPHICIYLKSMAGSGRTEHGCFSLLRSSIVAPHIAHTPSFPRPLLHYSPTRAVRTTTLPLTPRPFPMRTPCYIPCIRVDTNRKIDQSMTRS